MFVRMATEALRILIQGVFGMDNALPIPIEPRGYLTVRVAAMPADTNANGDIFGGYVLIQMDVAVSIAAAEHAKGRVATITMTR